MQNRFGQWCLLPTLSLPALLWQLRQLLSLLQCHLLDPVTSRKLEIPRRKLVKQMCLPSFPLQVLKVEIIWAIKCIDAYYSMNSCTGIGDVFHAMYPDSNIARAFGCADKKVAYLCTLGLGPYFSGQLSAVVKSVSNYVLLFDETLNKELQEKQMAVYFCFWERNTVVYTQFVDSMLLGHGTAEHLFEKLGPLVTSFVHHRLVQLSMDRPNVNLKLHRLIEEDTGQNTPTKMINIRTRGLHIPHNAFRAGCLVTTWEIELLLCSVYKLFRDAPARREDFQEVAEATTLPLKFCRQRYELIFIVMEKNIVFYLSIYDCTYLF